MKAKSELKFLDFKDIISSIVAVLECEDALAKVSHDYYKKTKNDMLIHFPDTISDTVFLLEKFLGDEETQWISYWLFEINCGKDYYHGSVTDEDGKAIPLKTIEDLWNCITKEDLCKSQ